MNSKALALFNYMLFISSGVAEYLFYVSPIANWEAGIETVAFLSDFLKLYTESSTISFLAPFTLTT